MRRTEAPVYVTILRSHVRFFVDPERPVRNREAHLTADLHQQPEK